MKRYAVRCWLMLAVLIGGMLLAPAAVDAVARPIDAAMTAMICA